MLKEIVCESWNWTAIGAIATAVASVTAIYTARVALHVGREPRRLHQEALKRRGVVAYKLLSPEMQVLRTVAVDLRHWSATQQLVQGHSLLEVHQRLDAPWLKNCLDMPEVYPMRLCIALADVYGRVLSLKQSVSFLSRLARGGEITVSSVALDSETEQLLGALESLEEVLGHDHKRPFTDRSL
ncbi:hypothetical protein QYQ99_00855 [Comamonas testosteroni]|uniref:hypothetical protein n=1 Tax=Comamonas testosteroni TaxID=285 RepID=UPI00265E6176|nr:hypothetical protein [Comamonas testosteroni]WKL16152.1 hypothetical protein QYQ99_00855 [Comamonas testosteroni]